MAKKKTTTATAENTVYIGKTTKGIAQFTTFKNGVIPHALQTIVNEDENIKHLIVPVSKLQQARRDIKIKGTLLNIYAQKQTSK